MTFLPCPKCGKQLIHDNQQCCADCAEEEANKSGLHLAVKITSFVILFIIMIFLAYQYIERKYPSLLPHSRPDAIERHITIDQYPNQRDEAKYLLDLIHKEPNKVSYQIFFEKRGETTTFGCDFKKEMLFRVHSLSIGHLSETAWQGRIMERLEAASNGGTLDDTRNGTIPPALHISN